MSGTWHFYTWDYRFTALLGRPEAVPLTGCAAAVEPNFSTWPGMPEADAIEAIRRKRTLAVAWQRAGVRIWADLDVAPEFAALNLAGVPRSWRSFATRAHRDAGPEGIERDFAIAAAHLGVPVADLRCVVFGGGARTRRLCLDRGWARVVEHSDRARGRPEGRLPKRCPR